MIAATDKPKAKVGRLLVWSIAATLGFLALYLFAYHLWWIFLLGGTALFALSFFIPAPVQVLKPSAKKTAPVVEEKEAVKDRPVAKGEVVENKPEKVSEDTEVAQLRVVLGPIPNRNPAIFLLKQAFHRFVFGQTTRTTRSQLQLINEGNEAAKALIERKRLAYQYKRVDLEETAETERVRERRNRVKKEADLQVSKIDAENEEALLRKDEATKKRTASSAKPAATETAKKEDREQNLKETERRLEALKNEKRNVQQDKSLTDEERTMALNDIDELIAETQHERRRYL